jgi:hypothetical protein
MRRKQHQVVLHSTHANFVFRVHAYCTQVWACGYQTNTVPLTRGVNGQAVKLIEWKGQVRVLCRSVGTRNNPCTASVLICRIVRNICIL